MTTHFLQRVALLTFVLLTLTPSFTLAQYYNSGQNIIMYANTVGPFSNPDETYPIFEQKGMFCIPAKVEQKDLHLGERLEGDMKIRSSYPIHYGKNVVREEVCTLRWDTSTLKRLKSYISQDFYFEFVLDNIPIHGFVGKSIKTLQAFGAKGIDEKFYYFNHLHFTILYNPDGRKGNHEPRGVLLLKIIYANVTRDNQDFVLLNGVGPQIVTNYYSVKWIKVNTEYSDRGVIYQDHFFAGRSTDAELEIHWLAILNSVVLVFLLTGFVAIILLRTVNSDFARYAQAEELDEKDDYGWKVIARDVFRFPDNTLLLSSFIGVGVQFLTMTVSCLALAVVGVYYPGNDGSLYVSALVLYALTSAVGGFSSSYYYKQLEGERWTYNTIVTASVFALPFMAMAFFVNTVAASYQVTKALPFTTIVTVLTIWGCAGLPLTLFGSIAGRRWSSGFNAPVRTKHFSRLIPVIPWYRHRYIQTILAGFLPFSAIYIELHYIFGSMWGRGTYQLWGILVIVFCILLMVTAMTTVSLTYFQLSLEDYRWWWPSFVWGGSTGFYILAYSFYFWAYRTRMTGFLQASFFFGYQLFICYYFFLMLGAVGFLSSLTFIRRLYSHLHLD